MIRHSALALLLATALTGCGDGGSDVGPLGGSGGEARLCTPVPGQVPVVFGNETLRNGGEGTVAIDSVRLIEPDGLTLTGAFLLPIQNNVLLGTRAVPPNAGPWSQRRPAAGATLAAQEGTNLALLLNRNDGRASFADIEVRYTAGGDSYNLRLAHSLEVVSSGTCSADDTA